MSHPLVVIYVIVAGLIAAYYLIRFWRTPFQALDVIIFMSVAWPIAIPAMALYSYFEKRSRE